jgi:hypothetical protein
MLTALKSFLVAAGIAIVASLALVYSECHGHAGDSCYIMQGLALYIGPALSILLWPLVAGILVIIRVWNRPPEA